MKKNLSILIVVAIFSFVACTNKNAEKLAKAKADSIAKVDSLNKVKATVDSIAKVDSLRKIAVDTTAKKCEPKKCEHKK